MRNYTNRIFRALMNPLGINSGLRFTLLSLAIIAISCKSGIGILESSNNQYIIGSGKDTAEDASMLQLTQPFRDSLNRVMNEQLAYNLTPMTKELPEGTLGNFCSDIWLKAAKEICKKNNLPAPSFAVFNHGGLRSALPSGYLTIRNAFELMPFENELVICNLNSAAKDSLLNVIARKGGAPVSGIRIQIAGQQATAISLGNPPTLHDSTYTIVTSDYLASGNDGFGIFKKGKTTSLQIKLRDVLINELKQIGLKGDTIHIQKDGRITKK